MAFWIPLAMAAGGALMGAQKHAREKEIEDADRKLAAETARYSWVTGMQPGSIRRAGSQFADIGQGALSGAMFGSQFAGASGGGAAMPDASGGMGGPSSFQNQSWYQKLQDQEAQKAMRPSYSMGGSWMGA